VNSMKWTVTKPEGGETKSLALADARAEVLAQKAIVLAVLVFTILA